MTPISFALLLTGVLLNASAQLLLKAGTNAIGRFEFNLDNAIPVALKLASEPHVMGGMLCYVFSLIVWIMALSRVPVSIAYPMLSIGYVVNAFIAWQWLGEPLATQKMVGIGIIVVGVFLVARS
jgi:multidrug transporter EmrE-like cation transporter